MAKYSQHLNVANFICKFGEQTVLLDLFEEVVRPAFLKSHVRSYGDDNKYFFNDTKLIDLSDAQNDEIAIYGTFVKQGKIAREQIFDEGMIKKDPKEMDTAPTSFFVLLLSNHKLLYVRQTPGAPTLQTFSSTISAFLKIEWAAWITSEFERLKGLDEKITKVSLYKKYPRPSVEIVELSSDSTIKEFIKKFKVINSVQIKLVDTNHEIDNSELFIDLRTVKNNLGADSLTIKNEKKGIIGLKKPELTALITAPAADGNSRITIQGIDRDDDKLSGNNNEFKLSVPIDLPSK